MTSRTKHLFYISPVIVWMLLIFLASTQLGAEQVTLHGLINLLKFLTPDQANALSADSIGKTNFLIRKCAHISEYAILALLIARAIQLGQARMKWQALLGAMGVSAGYACVDEFHQSFVSGRTSSIHDVLIDSTGAMFAIILLWVYFRIKAMERALWANAGDGTTNGNAG